MLELDFLDRVYILDYHLFDELVQSNFDWLEDYEIVADSELSNDSEILVSDVCKEPKYTWEKKDAEDFVIKQSKHNYQNVHTMLRVLVMRNVIPEGHYIIRISW